ncbi:MAG: hypothetical protein F6K25_06790 [Okeania sp. SIO2G4]|uniref:Uncharacterized protein n=3 Tax=Microcoleaceae TaxID=1892252 RepID=A0A3N6Q057_9CYAN|nr:MULTISPECIES: hypothetical protein [unclassified Okeania]NEP03640.1 hypothetical protein [Okeania sp. SIO4D6]RQH23103.1 hypothetical protein D4Z78_06635 [Okeania hirsuta]NEP71740.1 hypothetical protein [Okeania sp. SIO2G5]NEP92488.1 hypothetical protein [Okeania sp. SIO2F5]NEQ90440.1 hypothetical protein [Okeania sp. SIO2G4]
MTELSTEQLLYLLYTFAYSTEGTVTRSTVRNHLSKKRRPNAKQVCESLCELKLLESPKRGRIKVTEMGMKALVLNLQTTEYKFRSNKGPKILNALMACLKLTAKYNQINYQNEDMDFETFVDKFKKLYLEERRRQELEGVVAIRSKEICQKFRQNNHISELLLEKYFEQLKSDGLVFAVQENNKELIQWVN